MENDILEEKIYHFDEGALATLLQKERPWKKNPDHFRKVKISAVALIKMAMHA